MKIILILTCLVLSIHASKKVTKTYLLTTSNLLINRLREMLYQERYSEMMLNQSVEEKYLKQQKIQRELS